MNILELYFEYHSVLLPQEIREALGVRGPEDVQRE